MTVNREALRAQRRARRLPRDVEISSCTAASEPITASSAPTTTALTAAPFGSALNSIDPEAFRAVVTSAAEKLGVPGAMVLLRTPAGKFDVAFGTTAIGASTPPAADTHFRIASNTKTMTGALIVLLAQDGKLKFSDPVSSYVSGVPNGENITVADLLKMRSGLYRYGRPRARRGDGCRAVEGLDAAGGVGHRVPAVTAVRAGRLL